MVKTQLARTLRIALPVLLQIALALATALAGVALELPSAPTYNVRMEDAWIPMKDGVRLALKLYMPSGAKAGEQFPALVAYTPNSRDEWTAAGHFSFFSFF